MLSACQTLGLEAPRDLNDRAAYVTTGADALVVSTTNALVAHTITSDDASFITTTGRQLSALLAAVASDPDPKSAEGRLKLAEGILKQLQTYLADHKKVTL